MKFTKILLQALFVFSLLTACSADDKDEDLEKGPGTGDGTPGPKIPEGFNVLTPNYLGFLVNDTDETLDMFAEKKCAGQPAGTFFSMAYYGEKHDLHFCLDLFARPERANYETVCLDCKDMVNITNTYVGIVTDKSSKGVADISFITIVETPDLIRTRCESSDFGDTMRAGYGNNNVSKSVQEQWLSLQLEDGVCTNVKLDNYQDLQNVTMSEWAYETADERVARFGLTRIELQGREAIK